MSAANDRWVVRGGHLEAHLAAAEELIQNPDYPMFPDEPWLAPWEPEPTAAEDQASRDNEGTPPSGAFPVLEVHWYEDVAAGTFEAVQLVADDEATVSQLAHFLTTPEIPTEADRVPIDVDVEHPQLLADDFEAAIWAIAQASIDNESLTDASNTQVPIDVDFDIPVQIAPDLEAANWALIHAAQDTEVIPTENDRVFIDVDWELPVLLGPDLEAAIWAVAQNAQDNHAIPVSGALIPGTGRRRPQAGAAIAQSRPIAGAAISQGRPPAGSSIAPGRPPAGGSE